MMSAANSMIQRLLLCLMIIRNLVICLENSTRPVQIIKSEITKLPESLKISETSVSSLIKPRIMERRTVVPKQEEQQRNSVNETLLKKLTEEIEEDKTTITHIPGPISLESSSMKMMEFKPSVHIGEIHEYESQKSSTKPFNKLQHLQFDNAVSVDDLDTNRARAPLSSFSSSSSSSSSPFHGSEHSTPVAGRKKNRVKFFETDSRYGVALPIEYHAPQYHEQQIEEIIENQEYNNDNDNHNHNQLTTIPMGHEGLVNFEYPQLHYAEVTARPITLEQLVYPSMMTNHQMQLQHYEPGINNENTIDVKPSKLHGETEVVTPFSNLRTQHYNFLKPFNSEAIEKPKTLHDHRASYQVLPQSIDSMGTVKPETLLFLSSHRETAYTRTRKFPYAFYLPNVGQRDNRFYYLPEGQKIYSPRERVSTWKKIIHLIGAFIPLGLLLATLKPNVVQIENSTQPNIVLSKLRDLPAEHKSARIENQFDNVQKNICEDKSICESIVSGNDPHTNLLQIILWNLGNKSIDEEATKQGLREILEAVKQKDCSSIDCSSFSSQ